MNWHSVRAIFGHEMARFFRTIWQSLASPVLSTVLYFVVFGAAIGGRIQAVEGVPYGAFIVPGLIMAAIYRTLLAEIKDENFRVLHQRISLPPMRKLWLAAKTWIKG